MHELDVGIDSLRRELVERDDYLRRCEEAHRVSSDNLAYAKEQVIGLKTAIAALESLKP